jgi:serine protease AprX
MKRKRKMLLSTVATVSLAVMTFTTPFSASPADKPSLQFQGVSLIDPQGDLAKRDVPGSAKFLAVHSQLKIPEGLRKKLEIVPEDNRLYVVQLDGPVTENDKANLVTAGATIIEYVPDYAFIVDISKENAEKLEHLDQVVSVQAYLPLYKIDPQLFAKGASQLVKTVLHKTNQQRTEIQAKGIEQFIDYAYQNDILHISEKPRYKLMNDQAKGILKADIVQNNYGLYGSGQTVAVADTGLDTGKNDSSMHEAFRGKITSIYALGRTNNASDPHGHGTHVAGSVLGDAQFKGMAPKANLVFQSVMDSSGGLGGLPTNLNSLFSQAYNDGARIHTNSWGAAVNGAYTVDSKAVDEFVWNNDMTILFAAGNEGPYSRTISSPGTAKNAITVGATENYRPSFGSISDNMNEVASFSSRGPTADGRIKPDVMAPGTYVLSARSSLAPDSSFWANYNSKYAYMGGTSMATPLVAGTVALLREHFMKNFGMTPKPSLIKAALIAGAKDVGQGYPSYNQGWGRVELDKSLNIAYVNESKSLKTSEKAVYSFTADGQDPLKVALVWTDYPGNPSSSVSLVNDLDLVIKSPSGKQNIGNDFSYPYNNNWDGRNNIEVVVIPISEAGTYTIEVQAYNVPSGSQAFSLAVLN